MPSIYATCAKCKENQVSTLKAKYCRSCGRQRQRDYYHRNKDRVKSIIKRHEAKIGRRYPSRPKPTIPRVCTICQKEFLAYKYDVTKGGGLTCSRPCFHERYSSIRGTYQGTKPVVGNLAYQALHRWVNKELGQPKSCEFCKTTEGWFDWSNISGEYKRELSDWQRLCRKCHRKYDNISEKLKASWERKRAIIKS
jgi:hypothetical protein